MVLAVSSVAAFPLAACSLDTQTEMTQERVELVQDFRQDDVALVDLDESYVLALSEDYQRFGKGPVRISVAYDPSSRGNTAMKATDSAAVIAQALRKKGVSQVTTAIVPVRDLGEDSRVLLDYDVVKAQAPSGCTLMNGIDNSQTGVDENYRYGCSIESLLARQIHRPQDLQGNDARPDAYGRRDASVVSRYVFGVPNTPFDGESVSSE